MRRAGWMSRRRMLHWLLSRLFCLKIFSSHWLIPSTPLSTSTMTLLSLWRRRAAQAGHSYHPSYSFLDIEMNKSAAILQALFFLSLRSMTRWRLCHIWFWIFRVSKSLWRLLASFLFPWFSEEGLELCFLRLLCVSQWLVPFEWRREYSLIFS